MPCMCVMVSSGDHRCKSTSSNETQPKGAGFETRTSDSRGEAEGVAMACVVGRTALGGKALYQVHASSLHGSSVHIGPTPFVEVEPLEAMHTHLPCAHSTKILSASDNSWKRCCAICCEAAASLAT